MGDQRIKVAVSVMVPSGRAEPTAIAAASAIDWSTGTGRFRPATGPQTRHLLHWMRTRKHVCVPQPSPDRVPCVGPHPAAPVESIVHRVGETILSI